MAKWHRKPQTENNKNNTIRFRVIANSDTLEDQEIKKEIDGTDRIIQTYNYLSKNDYYIGNMNIDNKYLIQTKNWNFSSIPTDDSFIYKKYGIKNIGVDCIRYKYTWIEDWGEPILQNYIMANEGYSLEELEVMPFYK